jgi:hypothetical protein
VVGFYPAYIAVVLPDFEDKVNIYIATSRLSEFDVRKYTDCAIASQNCTVSFLEEGGKQVRIMTDEQSVTANFIRQCTNEEPANFSLKVLGETGFSWHTFHFLIFYNFRRNYTEKNMVLVARVILRLCKKTY